MEVVQYYLTRYHHAMERLGVLPPSIEPMASGHIIEQIALTQQILDAGFAYESNGSVYFDVEKYDKSFNYGELSGRRIEDMLSNTRALDGQDEKRGPLDFALWKKAQPEHIMRWPSPWGEGFPGWHAECTAMGRSISANSLTSMVVAWTWSSPTTSARSLKPRPLREVNQWCATGCTTT